MTGEEIVTTWLNHLNEKWPSFTALGDLVRRIDGAVTGVAAVPVVTPTKAGGGRAASKKVCTWKGCGLPHVGKGLCKTHYNRQRAGSDMDAPIKHRRAPTPRGAGTKAAEPPPEPAPVAPSSSSKQDTPKLITRADLTKNPEAAAKRAGCKALNRCSLIAKRKSWRHWTCSGCGGTSLGK